MPFRLNRYAYAHNNPLRFDDPSGLEPCERKLQVDGGGTVTVYDCNEYIYESADIGMLIWRIGLQAQAFEDRLDDVYDQSEGPHPPFLEPKASDCSVFANELVDGLRSKLGSAGGLMSWQRRYSYGADLMQRAIDFRDRTRGISGFRTDLTADGQGRGVYKHIQFVAGATVSGPNRLGIAPFMLYDFAQYSLSGFTRQESLSEIAGNRAGLAVGNALIDAMKGGNYKSAAASIRTTLCEF